MLIWCEGVEMGVVTGSCRAWPEEDSWPDTQFEDCAHGIPLPSITWRVTLTQVSPQDFKKARRYYRRHGGHYPLWGLGFDALFQPADQESRELLGWA